MLTYNLITEPVPPLTKYNWVSCLCCKKKDMSRKGRRKKRKGGKRKEGGGVMGPEVEVEREREGGGGGRKGERKDFNSF